MPEDTSTTPQARAERQGVDYRAMQRERGTPPRRGTTARRRTDGRSREAGLQW